MTENSQNGDGNRQKRAKTYDKIHNWLFVVDIILMLVLLCGMMYGGKTSFSFWLQDKVSEYTGKNPWAVTAVYMAVIIIGYAIIFLPYSWFKGFFLEHKYELSNQTFLKWLWDEVKSLFITLILAVIVFEIFYAFMRGAGSFWWLWAAVVWIVLQVVLGMLFPVVILPMFYKTTKLDRPDLEEKIDELATNAGVKVLGLFQINFSEKTKKANAALAGLGKTKRILLGDTLLDEFKDAEVINVLAHEFGHFYHRHIWKLMGVASVLAIGGMWLADFILKLSAGMLGIGAEKISSIATAPLFILALSIFGLVTMPLTNIISRYFERQADKYALVTTKDADSFISAMERLADQNLANKEPHPAIEFLLHSHPSIARRVEFARKYK